MRRIDELDPNMAIVNRIEDEGIEWIPARGGKLAIEGLHMGEDGPFRRMPGQVASRVSEGVAQLALCTAGGRARFVTDSPYVAVRVALTNAARMDHMAFTGILGFDLYVRRAPGDYVFRGAFRPPVEMCEGYDSILTLPGGMCEAQINFPLYSGVAALSIGIKRGSRLELPDDYAHARPVVYYGSSITQGGCASRPGNSYQAIIGRMLDCDYVNLGFSGNAKGEPAMAEYIAGLDMSVFVCDYDHNAPSCEHLAATHRPLYEAVRARNAGLPVIFVTCPDVDWHSDDTAHFGEVRRRRDIVRATYEYARAQGDERVAFIDGADLFAGDMRDSCTVDGCHPNDLGFMRMARVIGAEVVKWL
ncbi:MAG: SGNH/GDSL hydrolase family protein [Candidatus Fimadaptatus sp.]